MGACVCVREDKENKNLTMRALCNVAWIWMCFKYDMIRIRRYTKMEKIIDTICCEYTIK